MSPCYEIAPGVHVCRPRGAWERVQRQRRKRWWCFKCRKHLLHTLMVFRQVQPSYYDDFVKWECPNCHEEHVLFPGREWRFDDA